MLYWLIEGPELEWDADQGLEDGSVWVDGSTLFGDELEWDAADQAARGDL